MYVCAREWVRERERERKRDRNIYWVSVCVKEREGETKCVCEWERNKKTDTESTYLCVNLFAQIGKYFLADFLLVYLKIWGEGKASTLLYPVYASECKLAMTDMFQQLLRPNLLTTREYRCPVWWILYFRFLNSEGPSVRPSLTLSIFPSSWEREIY